MVNADNKIKPWTSLSSVEPVKKKLNETVTIDEKAKYTLLLNKVTINDLHKLNPLVSRHDIYTILECAINAKILRSVKEFEPAYLTYTYYKEPYKYAKVLRDINNLLK